MSCWSCRVISRWRCEVSLAKDLSLHCTILLFVLQLISTKLGPSSRSTSRSHILVPGFLSASSSPHRIGRLYLSTQQGLYVPSYALSPSPSHPPASYSCDEYYSNGCWNSVLVLWCTLQGTSVSSLIWSLAYIIRVDIIWMHNAALSEYLRVVEYSATQYNASCFCLVG